MRNAAVLVLAAVSLMAVPTAAAASAWSPPAGFRVPSTRFGDEAAPRVAIGPDGRSVVGWVVRGTVLVSTGDRAGRFSSPEPLGHTVTVPAAVAAGRAGEALVAWEDRDGLHVAVRTGAHKPWRSRLAAASTGSPIGGVTATRDARGGWIVAERQFPPRGTGAQYRVRTLVLHGDGAPALRWQDLGLGVFGIDARPASALAPAEDGGGTLVFEGERSSRTVEVTASVHGSHFVPPTALPSSRPLADPWLATVPGGPTFVAATQVSRCGDVACFGSPFVWAITNGTTPVRAGGPDLAHPARAFHPSVAPIGIGDAALVFQLKTGTDPFSAIAPVRAAVIRQGKVAGGIQTLTSRPASEAEVLPLAEGRALAVWAGARGFGASIAGPNGRFYPVRAPIGPPPAPYHFNATNRDARTAGDWAAVAWQAGTRVRVSVRRFAPGVNALKAARPGV